MGFDNDNDGKGPIDPVEQSARDAASDAALKEMMPVLLPKLHAVFDQIRAQGLDDPETPVKRWLPVAATYRLWHEASINALLAHYNRFEQPLTVAGRAEELPHAAKEYAEDLTGLNEQEAIAEYIDAQQPPLDLPQKRALHEAFAEVKKRAIEVDTTSLTAFPGKGKPGGQER